MQEIMDNARSTAMLDISMLAHGVKNKIPLSATTHSVVKIKTLKLSQITPADGNQKIFLIPDEYKQIELPEVFWDP